MCSHAPCFPAKVSERTAVSCRHEDILYVLLFPLSSVLVYYRIPIADASCLSTDPSYTQSQRASSAWFIPSRDATPFVADKMGHVLYILSNSGMAMPVPCLHIMFLFLFSILSFTWYSHTMGVRERREKLLAVNFSTQSYESEVLRGRGRE